MLRVCPTWEEFGKMLGGGKVEEDIVTFMDEEGKVCSEKAGVNPTCSKTKACQDNGVNIRWVG